MQVVGYGTVQRQTDVTRLGGGFAVAARHGTERRRKLESGGGRATDSAGRIQGGLGKKADVQESLFPFNAAAS